MLNTFPTTLDKEFLIKRCVEDDKGIENLEEVLIAKLCSLKICNISKDFSELSNLTVCLLGGNYITSIDGILCCRNLVKLDLHGNQIKQLPNKELWSNLEKLQVLLLHDNLLSSFSCAFNLSTCSSLVALTMFNNPICTKLFYRHQLVNAIWSLKLLDKHVIADCEVIEDLRVTPKFSAVNSNLYLNPCTQNNEAIDNKHLLELELCSMKHIVKEINKIQALNSPVLIVQKFWRGYLVRKELFSDTKEEFKRHLRREKLKSLLCPDKRALYEACQADEKHVDENLQKTVASLNKQSPASKKKRNHNLLKIDDLLSEELQNLKLNKKCDTSYLLQNKKFKMNHDAKHRPKTKAGNLIMTSQSEELGTLAFESDHQSGQNGESVHVQAVLSSKSPPVKKSLPATEQELLRKRQMNIVKAENTHFTSIFNSRSKKKITKTPAKKKQPKSDPESLSILTAVIRAYSNNFVEDKTADNINKVVRIQNARDQQAKVVQYFNEEKRHLAIKKKLEDKAMIDSKISKNNEERLKYIKLSKARNKSSVTNRRANHNEYIFTNEFVTQHAAVTNQIAKCKWRENKQQKIEDRKELVHNIREEARVRKEIKSHQLESLRIKVRNFDTSIYNNNLYRLDTSDDNKKEVIKQQST